MEKNVPDVKPHRKTFRNPTNQIIRIYWQHDLDLAALCYYNDFSISYWMKQALIAYVRKDETFSIPIPEERPLAIEHKTKYAHFKLNEESEADVIEFVRSFRYGFCSNGIKRIMRLYLSDPFLNVYMSSSPYTLKPTVPKSRERIFKKKERFDHTKSAFPDKE